MAVGEVELDVDAAALLDGPGPDLDQVVDLTRGLVELVSGHQVAHLSVHAGAYRWEIDGPPVAVPAPAPLPAPPAAADPGADHLPVPVAHEVRAPLVGVLHRSPAPGAPPFVEVGARVAPGQQLAVVEALRMRNEVVADRAGVLRAVHADDGEIVEFGQLLFTVVPA